MPRAFDLSVQERMVELYKSGVRIIEIKALMGIRSGSICKVLKRKGMVMPGHCRGDKHPNWKGGVRKIYPYRKGMKRNPSKSIVIAEKMLGRRLEDKEIVHHIDVDHSNEVESNIYVVTNQKEHCFLHASLHNIMGVLIRHGTIEFKDGVYQYG
jgi:hypothetical protein